MIHCIVCGRKNPDSSAHVCSSRCETEWDLEQEIDREAAELAYRERMEDPNPGRWSYLW